MARQSRATAQKREKEKARQQKQHEKVQRRLAAKARRADGAPPGEGDEPAWTGLGLGPHALPEQEEDAIPMA